MTKRTVSKRRTINLTPRGLETQEGIIRVNKATTEFERATAEVANAAAQFFNHHHSTLHTIAGTGYIMMSQDERLAFGEDLHQLEALIGARARKQEEFLRSVAGAPPMPE